MNCLKLIIISLWSKIKNVQCMILYDFAFHRLLSYDSNGVSGEVLEAEVPYIANRSFYLCNFQFTIFVHCNICKPDPHWLSLLYLTNLQCVWTRSKNILWMGSPLLVTCNRNKWRRNVKLELTYWRVAGKLLEKSTCSCWDLLSLWSLIYRLIRKR